MRGDPRMNRGALLGIFSVRLCLLCFTESPLKRAVRFLDQP